MRAPPLLIALLTLWLAVACATAASDDDTRTADLIELADADLPPDLGVEASVDADAGASADLVALDGTPEEPLEIAAEVAPDVVEVADALDDAVEPAELVPEEVEIVPEVVTPPSLVITVNGIPPEMNGSVPYLGADGAAAPFRLLLPPSGFTIDVAVTPGSAPVDPASLSVTSSSPGVAFEIDEELSPGFTWDGEAARWRVPVEQAFLPADRVVLQAAVVDVDGLPAEPASIEVGVADLVPALDPFPDEDLWLVDFRRDNEEVTAVMGEGGVTVTSTRVDGGNGVADFDEALMAIGFLGADATFNQGFVSRFKDGIRAHIHQIFLHDEDGSLGEDGVNIRFVFDGDEGAPDPADFSPDGDFSMIAVGGDYLDGDGQPLPYLGMAWLDWNNQEVDDNSDYGHGVFFTNLLRKAVSFPALTPLFALIMPGTGLPLGEHPGDMAFLAPDYDPAGEPDAEVKKRFSLFRLFMEIGSLGGAALISHEVGHSIGLVPSGEPPWGLFGGLNQSSFIVGPSDGYHVNTPGLNLMQSGSDFQVSDLLSGYPAFYPLNRAYLQRRLVVDPGFEGWLTPP
jgi:hypothetical protein